MTAPRDDELEIAVLGRGYGECLLVHVGAHRWIVIDSFRDEAGQPAARTYLQSLDGGEAEHRVVAVVISHWDDDHTKGIADVIAAHSPGEVWMPAVLDNDEAFAFAIAHDAASAGSPVPSGLKEFVSVIRTVGEDRRRYGTMGRLVTTGTEAAVRLLSPHDAVVGRGLRSLGITQQPGFGEVASPKPNATSIALWVDWEGRTALLGADLVKTRWGWRAVVDGWADSAKAQVLKVPHHGSPDAHLDEMYERMCRDDVLAAVTRFTACSPARPTTADRDRIRPLVGAGWVLGAESRKVVGATTPEELHEAASTVDGFWRLRGPVGQIRARCDSAGNWSTEVSGAYQDV